MAAGLKVAARYSFRPHSLGFCGPRGKNSSRILFDYLSGKDIPGSKVREILEKFEGAFAYYDLIARANKIADPFDERVVRAYWIGSELLENVSVGDFRKMVQEKFKMPEKAKLISRESRPHHSFHIKIIGSVTGRIKFNNKLRNLCRISWGKVKQVKRGKLLIEKKEIDWQPEFLPGIRAGDLISVHWNQACEILDKEDVASLEKYTV